MDSINMQFLITMSIIGIGYILKRRKILSARDGEGLSKILLNILLPAVIINTFKDMQLDSTLIALPFINIGFGILMAGAALIFFRREGDGPTRGMLSMLVPGFNIGLFAFPLIESIYGSQGLKYLAMFDMGNSFVVFVISYILGEYFSNADHNLSVKYALLRSTKSIPLFIYALTITLKLTGFYYPSFVVDIAKVVAPANKPVALLLLGIFLKFQLEGHQWKKILKVVSLRYSLGLLAGLLFFIFLPFDPLYKTIVAIGLILPIGSAVLPFSIKFGYDSEFVGTLTNATNIISFALMWIISVIRL